MTVYDVTSEKLIYMSQCFFLELKEEYRKRGHIRYESTVTRWYRVFRFCQV